VARPKVLIVKNFVRET